MKCYPSSDDPSSVVLPGFTTLLLALVNWISGNRNTGDPAPSSIAGPSESQSPGDGSCGTTVDQEWEWHCGMEVLIFTKVNPPDLLAMAGLFHQADVMSTRLGCSDADYPIKAVVAGGTYEEVLAVTLVMDYLGALRLAGLGPSEARFSIEEQVLPGPVTSHLDYVRDVQAPELWVYGDTPDDGLINSRFSASESPILSVFETLFPRTASVMIRQRAPIIVALRPLLEFAVLWSESLRISNAAPFQFRGFYESARSRGLVNLMPNNVNQTSVDQTSGNQTSGNQTSGDATLAYKTLVQETMQAFERSRIVASYNSASYSRLGKFFAKFIMDPHATADANMATEELEKSLLVLPQQFLLVERAGMIMDENLHGNRLFTYKTQPEVWNSIRANFQAGFRKLWNYIRDVNDATTFSLSGKLKKAFQGTEPAVIKLDLQYLEQLAWTMSEAEVLGHDVAGIVAQWKSAVGDVREKLRRQFAASTGPGQAMDYAVRQFAAKVWRRFDAWVGWAPHADSFVYGSSLLLPFCLEPGSNLVKDSFQQVWYDGQDEQGQYNWPPAGYSQSSIWMTNRPPTNVNSTMRYDRLRREIRDLYVDAFTP